jgi:DNA-binding CsgD family transcriptional regulator
MTVAKKNCGLSSNGKASPFPRKPDVVRASDPATPAYRLDGAPSRETLPPLSAADEEAGAVSSVFARQVRMAYGLLQAAIEEAAETVECSHVKIAAEFEDLQARAIRSMRESALATIDLFEAMSAAQMPGEFAKRQLELAQRRRETVNDRLVDFFESARNIASIMTDPLSRQLRALACAKSAERGAPEAGDSILSRVNTLTGRQKVVLGLLTEGLPNKVIAHQLSISETTVKAHVGEILRKLKVYNRARVIVMLAQFDMRQTCSLPFGEDAESE